MITTIDPFLSIRTPSKYIESKSLYLLSQSLRRQVRFSSGPSGKRQGYKILTNSVDFRQVSRMIGLRMVPHGKEEYVVRSSR